MIDWCGYNFGNMHIIIKLWTLTKFFNPFKEQSLFFNLQSHFQMMFVRHALSLSSHHWIYILPFPPNTKKEMTNKGEKESLLKANFKTIYLLSPLAIMVVFWQAFGNLAPKEITFWKNRILACNYLQRNLIPIFFFLARSSFQW